MLLTIIRNLIILSNTSTNSTSSDIKTLLDNLKDDNNSKTTINPTTNDDLSNNTPTISPNSIDHFNYHLLNSNKVNMQSALELDDDNDDEFKNFKNLPLKNDETKSRKNESADYIINTTK
jgi:hypothetical protein